MVFPLEEDVGGHSRPVDDGRDAGFRRLCLAEDPPDAGKQGLRRVRGGGRDFRGKQRPVRLAYSDDVRKRSPRVNADPELLFDRHDAPYPLPGPSVTPNGARNSLSRDCTFMDSDENGKTFTRGSIIAVGWVICTPLDAAKAPQYSSIS